MAPGYGHRHHDGLDLLLWANGHELISDLGYTHTAWREWTVQSPSHNLVVVDQIDQLADRTTHGDLRYFFPGDPVQVVAVDNPQIYPGLTDTYRRTLALVKLDEMSSHPIDLFRVEGGSVHHHLLNGDADVAQTIEANLPASPRGTLVPADVEFVAGRNEQDFIRTPGHACGHMSELRPAPGVSSRSTTASHRW